MVMYMNLKNWGKFRIADIFSCETTKALDINLIIEGNIPYITRSAINNGISMFCGNDECLVEGNCITIGAEGKVPFYQAQDFVAGIKVYTLRNSNLNFLNGMFLVTILSLNSKLYSYGRARVLDKIKNERIRLPMDINGKPDWDYMAKYTESLNHKPITTSIGNNPYHLNLQNWVSFKYSDLFKIVKGKRLTKADMIEGTTNYIGAISDNNGVRELISNDESINLGNCITVNYNGSVGEAFYQEEPFWASDDVNILYLKNTSLNKYIAMFICTLIKLERNKYSYGRKWKLEVMVDSIIKLPSLIDGSPDWCYMENYIKSFSYSDKI